MSEEKPHGNTGRRNAMKGDKPLSTSIAFRAPPELKERAEKQAASEGLKLSQWLLQLVERALSKPTKKGKSK